MNGPLLDTHAWIWWIHGDARLGRATLAALDQLDAAHRPSISAISLWEVAMLVSRGRVAFDCTLEAWLEKAAHPLTVRTLPITPQIAADVAHLPEALTRDPADRLIVSTGRVHGLRIVTKDAVIADSGLLRRWSAR
ncbi:MAG TPA: type II toxin-antitoxin system VapC family toxin [Vicinamibacterales bacterium]|nr:type II toxin-antitoxin system VapC family toxin [Vicinamibacterales bacterium]